MKKMLFASLVIILIAGGVDLISHIEAQEESYPAKEFKLPERYKNRVLPPKADNRTKYLRTPFEHMGHPCAFAASICYNFTYEINFLRDLPSDNDDNLYPYTYAYHFYNDGSGSASCANIVDGYRIAMATGVPNNTAMGGFTAGYPTKWLNTYDKYYEAMHNRVVEYYFFDCKTTDGFQNLKQWLYDHASGTTGGGLANFNVDCMGIGTSKIASGPEAGKTLITAFGSSSNYNHSLTVVGYNDSISYDFNNDGQITNEIDINRDGKVDLQDREEGAFCIINSHIVWDEGFAYCAYNLFSTPPSQGGIGRNNEVYCLKTVENFEPKYTLKATITHSSRENIKIYAGIASDINATEPTKVKSYAGAFNYAGGDFPMEGENMDNTIEIGLDVSDLIDSISGTEGAFFLCIDSRTGGSGTVNNLSLMDYTGATPQEIPYKKQDIPITGNIILGGITNPTAIKYSGISYIKSDLLITPNPVMQGKNISFVIPEPDFRSAQIQLYNLNGKMILQQKVYQSHTLTAEMATTSLAAGIYKVLLTIQKPNNIQKRYNATIYIF